MCIALPTWIIIATLMTTLCILLLWTSCHLQIALESGWTLLVVPTMLPPLWNLEWVKHSPSPSRPHLQPAFKHPLAQCLMCSTLEQSSRPAWLSSIKLLLQQPPPLSELRKDTSSSQPTRHSGSGFTQQRTSRESPRLCQPCGLLRQKEKSLQRLTFDRILKYINPQPPELSQ